MEERFWIRQTKPQFLQIINKIAQIAGQWVSKHIKETGPIPDTVTQIPTDLNYIDPQSRVLKYC